MSSPLPLRPSIDHTPRSRSVIDLTDENSTAVFEALGSETARSILETLDDQPATASDLADEVETSLQNVQYHLDNLHDASLVAEVGTWYSSRGKEMSVYALSSERLEFRLSRGTAEVPGGDPIDPEDTRTESSRPSFT